MKKCLLLSLLACSTLALGQAASSSAPQDLSTLHGRPEPPMLGIHWARGFDPFARSNQAGGRKTPHMTYHGQNHADCRNSDNFLGSEVVEFDLHKRQDLSAGFLIYGFQQFT